MAFVVEDGTGLSTANGYIATAYADTYHADRGHTSWDDATTTQKEQAIVRATDHIDRIYGNQFKGYRQTQGQSLCWPRTNAYDYAGYAWTYEVPAQLQKATAEYALRAYLYGVLTPDLPPITGRQTFESGETLPAVGDPVGFAKKRKDAVGPIEESVEYSTTIAGQESILPMYPAADAMLKELLTSVMSKTLIRG